MNQFFYEQRGREKVRDLQNEGQRSQAFYRSQASKPRLLNGLPRIILIIMGILGMLEILVR